MHFLIIIEHGHAACQYRHSQDAAQTRQNSHRAPVASCLHPSLVHFLLKVLDDLIIHSCFCPWHILAQYHVILHHLVALIIYAVSSQFVKSVGGCYVNSFLALQTAVQIHELVLSRKILAVLLPIGQGA